MPEDAVARLLAAVAADGEAFDLYHFNVEQIDAQGTVTDVERPYPPHLPVREYIRQRFAFELASYAPDYVFRRRAFAETGGFVPFPFGWGADDATWVRLGWRAGIRTLAGRPVQWRLSGQNISARQGDAVPKLLAQLALLRWLQDFLAAHPPRPGEPADAQVLQGAAAWFLQQAKQLRTPFSAALMRRACAVLPQVAGVPRGWALRRVLHLDLRARWMALRLRLRGR